MASSGSRGWRSLVTVLAATLVVAGAGFAAARTTSGPPWALEPDDPAEIDRVQVRAEVEEFFAAVDGECGAEVLGEADLGDDATLLAFDALVTGLKSGQTSHMVNSVRVLLENCADHANDGLRNALYHHGLNWVRHYEHEQWLREKFADKWPDGKPGNGGGSHGNPHETETAGGRGNGHVEDHGNGSSNGNGNANGHSK
ncbi:MAG: hypothetical protein ACRDGW_12215 [Actinomycetota bacterium]